MPPVRKARHVKDAGRLQATPRLVLASASPRRKQLLAEAGYRFTIRPSHVSEEAPDARTGTAEGLAVYHAWAKARAVAPGMRQAVVLGADTVVALDGGIIGKPAGHAGAIEILRRLSGTRHRVITGICVLRAPERMCYVDYETTYITMRHMPQAEIERYVASGEAFGKAGAYAVQETGDRFVERIDGSFTNVVGLPMELVVKILARFGVRPETCRPMA